MNRIRSDRAGKGISDHRTTSATCILASMLANDAATRVCTGLACNPEFRARQAQGTNRQEISGKARGNSGKSKEIPEGLGKSDAFAATPYNCAGDEKKERKKKKRLTNSPELRDWVGNFVTFPPEVRVNCPQLFYP